MASIELNVGEALIKESMAIRIISKIKAENGILFLTSQRLVFRKGNKFLTALIGSFALLSKGKLDFDILLTNVSEVSRYKFGLNSNMLYIKTFDDKEYKFNVQFNYWLAAIKNIYIVYHKVRLIKVGEMKWIVK